MNSVDMQGSFNNLSQMDRHQQDSHRMPVVHQDQNAVAHQHEAAKRIDKPTQGDEAERKTLDSEAKKREFFQRRRRKKQQQEEKRKRSRRAGGGLFVDYDA